MNTYIIGYDITNPKRLGRIHRALKNHAVPLQYSLFLLEGSQTDFHRCLDDILPLLDRKSDDLRCYPLPKRGLRKRIGKPLLPEGIILTSLPEDIS